MPPRSKSSSSSSESPLDVLLFVPNLIGYARIALAVAACACLGAAPIAAVSLYTLSCVLDALDGHAARYYNQSTKFGAVLDMVTDRSTTACLLIHLATTHPSLSPIIQLLVALDLSSHYFAMYSSLSLGVESHKTMSDDANGFLRLYYTNKIVLFAVCALDQLFYICVYLLGWRDATTGTGLFVDGGAAWWALVGLSVFSGSFFLLKQVLNVIQLVGASMNLARADVNSRRKGKAKAM